MKQLLLLLFFLSNLSMADSCSFSDKVLCHKSENSESDTQLKVGDSYYYGKGVKIDYQKAKEWYLKSAEKGNPVAQLKLGGIYYDGLGVRQDYQKAIGWYLKSAAQGNSIALYYLGDIYLYGKGVKQDKSKSKKFFGESCDHGEQYACDNYKRLNDEGVN